MAKQQIKLAWHQRDPQEFKLQKKEVQVEYPHLHFYLENEVVFIRGSFPIKHQGNVVDRHSIEIELPSNYPEAIPIVRETTGGISRTPDNHFNTLNGEVCLFALNERWQHFPSGASLLDFLNGPVRNHFLGLSLRKLGEPWPFGERSHGREGILESYSEILGTDDERTIVRYVEYLSKPKIKGHWPCPCGNGKKLRHCHLAVINNLREKITLKTAIESLKHLVSN